MQRLAAFLTAGVRNITRPRDDFIFAALFFAGFLCSISLAAAYRWPCLYWTRPEATARLAAMGTTGEGYNRACHLFQFRLCELSKRLLIQGKFIQFVHKTERLLFDLNSLRLYRRGRKKIMFMKKKLRPGT